MNKITPKELKLNIGYLLAGFFTYYLVEPIRIFVDSKISISPLVFGFAGLLITLWAFDLG